MNEKSNTCQNASSVSILSKLTALLFPGWEANAGGVYGVTTVTASGVFNALKPSLAKAYPMGPLDELLSPAPFCLLLIHLTYSILFRLVSGGYAAFFTSCDITITMIIQMANAVPIIEMALNTGFSLSSRHACLKYCFIISGDAISKSR